MSSRLKYWLVLLGGALFIAAAVGSSLFLSRNQKASSETKEAATFSVEDRSVNREGNGSVGDEKPSTAVSSEEKKTTVSPTAERKSPTTSAPTTAEETKTENAEETTEPSSEPEEIPVGLPSYFEKKLIVDPEKTEKYLNVREEPNETSEILAVLYPCEIVEYLSVKDNWYEIQVDETSTGYVSGEYILTDGDAYEAGKHHVGYRVMCREFETVFYENPDDSVEGILACDMGETFYVTGITDGYFRVEGRTQYYPVLYVRCRDVLLYYVYLGSGQTNGLSEDMEDYLAGMDLTGCEEEARELQQRAISEKSRIAAERQAEKEAEEAAIREAAEAKAAARQAEAKANGLGISEANVANVNLSPELTAYTLNLCAQYGVDSAVIFAVMYQESRFDPNCTSASGAIGLMQIIPRYHSARIQSLGVTDLYDPSSNILVGVDLLADYYYQEGGDWVRALTRYRYGVADGSADYANLIFSYVPMFQ